MANNDTTNDDDNGTDVRGRHPDETDPNSGDGFHILLLLLLVRCTDSEDENDDDDDDDDKDDDDDTCGRRCW